MSGIEQIKNELTISRVSILGVGVHALSMLQSLKVAAAWIQTRQPGYICFTPAHALMDCYDHPEIRQIYNNSGLTTPDGMPIVWLLRWYGHRNVERVYGPDFLLEMCKYSLAKGYRHFFYGSTIEVLDNLKKSITERYPDLKIVGFESPPFRSLSEEEEIKLIKRIHDAAPDILWVGLGSPKQEIWMSKFINRLNVPVLAGVGAAFDFLSGNKPQAPRWMQRIGLEWFFRLVTEPRRLWRRYLLQYPRFIFLVVMQMIGLKKYPMENI